MKSDNDFEFTIESGKTERHYWLDLWRYRELFYILAWRDVSVQYKQTVMGVLWAVLRPLLTMVIMVVVFGKIAKLPSDGVPYPIFVFSAILPWTFFATAFATAGNSLIGNASLISKVYFPRLIIPAAAIIVAAVDFLISFIILIVLMYCYSYPPTIYMLALPFFMFIAFFAALGSSLFISALNVKYRDFRFIIPFVAQLGMYVSPVAFSTSLVPERYQYLYYLNPMVAVIDGFRWSVSAGEVPLGLVEVLFSLLTVSFTCILGAFYFRKTEKTFADTI